MYLDPFAYYAPASVDETVTLLASLPEAKVLAGGQSLIPLMNLGLARPAAVVDVNGLPNLDAAVEHDGFLHLGALVRHRTLETSPVVGRACPLLREAAAQIGNIRVRHRGTIGGSLAHADPAAELPLVAVTCDATVEIQGTEGVREVGAAEFFRGYLETDLQPAELVTGVRFSVFTSKMGHGLAELVRRSGDFAIVAACAVVELDDGGHCRRASLALGGVGPYPIRMRDAEELLVGRPLAGRVIDEAVAAVPGRLSPESDIHASAGYRRAMAAVMASRAIGMAAARAARGGAGI
jgi:aerobic carbon-monoxide dehydrogenase medium subunit